MENMLTTAKWTIASLLLGLALCASPVGATEVDLHFNSLPSAQGWTFSTQIGTRETDVFSVDGMALHQNSLGILDSPKYVWQGIVERAPFDLQFRVRLTEYQGPFPTEGAFTVFLATGDFILYVELGPGLVVIDEVATGGNPRLFLDTAQYHDYRVLGDPALGKYRFFVDGQEAWERTIGPASGNSNFLMIGDQKGAGIVGNSGPQPIGAKADLAFFSFHQRPTGGFNANSLVTFTPLSSTYRTVSSTSGCPAGYVGKFTFSARLMNKSSSPGLPGVDARVQTLSNGNLLLNPQTNELLGGAGAIMPIPKIGKYSDGLLSGSEWVDVPFAICLKNRFSFQFFVDVYGIFTKLVSINRAGTDSGNRDSFASYGGLSSDGRFVGFTSAATNLVAATEANHYTMNNVFVRDRQTGKTTLVSVNQAGTNGGNGPSHSPLLSADGRFVAFTSDARDLVAIPTTAGRPGVFVRDLQTESTTLVSVNRVGTNSGYGGSFWPVLSADARFVAFTSDAIDLVGNDTNGMSDVFVRDLQMGTTALVSVNRAGTDGGNRTSFGSSLSADGRFVVFTSEASNLVTANDNNGLFGPASYDVFVRDLQSGTTTLVSANQAGTGTGNGGSDWPVISADGRFVTFWSEASDLVATDTNGARDVFVRDLQTGTTTLVSVNQTGTDSGNDASEGSVLSAEGRFVVFTSLASDLAATDTNGARDVFVRDLQTGTTTLVSVNQTGTDSGKGESGPLVHPTFISPDGRFVAFSSSASDLVAIPTSGRLGMFVRDLKTGTTTLMSVNQAGTAGANFGAAGAGLSADGRVAQFYSSSSDLVSNDTNGQMDVFVRPMP